MGARRCTIQLSLAATVALLILMYVKFINERYAINYHQTLSHWEATEEWTQRIGRHIDIWPLLTHCKHILERSGAEVPWYIIQRRLETHGQIISVILQCSNCVFSPETVI